MTLKTAYGLPNVVHHLRIFVITLMPGNRKQFYFGEEDHKSDDKSVKVHVENRECASKQTATSLLCIGLIGCTTKNVPIKCPDPFLRVLRPHGGVRDDLSVEIGHPSVCLTVS
ncbi:hypothetical protein TNCT_309661 [Trichonephila clavata]|uniref:Uncharacterized protein n=1 Tax=Trichonephila clavata TaxID=2740835 RepID=A0A8X6K6S7_TRICU|nr:hypothetical protein TNCT_309661 [Trichonephila clavata]